VPVRATFDPVGSTATALLGAVLSDIVILNSPTTTEFGREMFESTSDVSELDAAAIASRDAKEYTVGDRQSLVIAQIETVGEAVLERRDELLEELAELRAARGLLLYALMVTDIMAKGTKMLVAGDHGLVERVFGQQVVDGTIDLPGVMSRKKQVAPKLMAAL
jgi:manganese-dependent inorganic pyrophosphatase